MPRFHRRATRALAILGVMTLLAAIPAGVAGADGHVVKRLAFTEAAGELPEGVAVDKVGNVFVSIAPLGELWKIAPGSSTPEVFGVVPGIDPATDLGLLGLAVDAAGNVYGGVASGNLAANGVWKFDRKTGSAERIPGSEATGIANDVAFDKRGNLYVTDSALGAIWIKPARGVYQPWSLGDPNLQGTGVLGLPVPIGANGIEYRHGVLYVGNTERFSVVAVPIEGDGSPGASEVLAVFPPDLLGFPGAVDGLALDVHGNIYVALIAQNAIAVVAPDGEVSTLAAGDPLDWPSSVAFGTGKGDRQTLFAVNFSIGEGNGDPFVRSGPGLVAIDAGVPGLPLP